MFKDEGVIVFKNEYVFVVFKYGIICYFVGVDDLLEGQMNLKRVVFFIEFEQFIIFLSYNFDVIYYVDEELKIDLILSGYIYGGQICLFNLGMYELGGLKEKRKIFFFVSNGYGIIFLFFCL